MIVRSLLVALAAAFAGWLRWLLRRPKRVAHALIVSPPDHTTVDETTGAVRSVQSADLIIPAESIQEIWAPRDLVRLARTYWRFLTRATLGIVQIDYQEDGRQVKAFGLIPLLTFHAPEYEMSTDRGIVSLMALFSTVYSESVRFFLRSSRTRSKMMIVSLRE